MVLTLRARPPPPCYSNVEQRSINTNNKHLGYNNKERQVFVPRESALTLANKLFYLRLLLSNASFPSVWLFSDICCT